MYCKDISTYMNISWDDIHISNSLNIDLSLSYNHLESNCYINDVFFQLSESYLSNSSNTKIKIWSQRLKGSNDLWLNGYLKDNVGEFSIEPDLTEIDMLWLTEEEVNNYSSFYQGDL